MKRYSIYNLIKEADGDDGSDIINGGPANSDTGDTGADDANGDDTAADTDNNADQNQDDDFNIDTDLDDEGDGDTEADTGGGDDIGGGGSEPTTDDGEVNAANTDIFSSLSAEEQKLKITRLKKQYNDLYTYLDDLLKKMNELDVEEDTLDVIYTTSSHMYDLKNYLSDYLISVFPYKSFIENDIFFNRFCAIVSSISNIIEELASRREKLIGLEDDKN